MKTQTSHLGLAVLSAQHHSDLPVLSFSVGQIDTQNSNRVQILPDGVFTPDDGRKVDTLQGHWLMDEHAFAALKAQAALRANDYHFDYEHQTIHSETNGQPAPAAGWFKDLEYVPGEGVFANNINWTDKAKQFIADKEYRFASAVFAYDRVTGRPTQLKHIALTNAPALDGMNAIAALKRVSQPSTQHPTGDSTMNEALTLLLSMLGIEEAGDLSNEVALKAANEKAKVAIAALKAKADQAGNLEAELNTARESVAALKAKQTDGNKVDLSQYVPMKLYDERVQEIAVLKAGSEQQSVEQLLKDNADKILASENEFLTEFAEQQGVAALKSMLDNRVAVVALKSQQSQGQQQHIDDEQLTDEQLYVAEQLGIDPKEFKT
ncbi:phage scaffold protein [Shewanella sp. WXL01]|uniref:phage protease n=1 Tax=Shewanella sp. WXL01 TaxID=2709721 RepID=UPI0014386BB3|nr:phage protease [Shewanella sp. WXL01]NKF51369.1 phage scaffold protein [Shewanella sp. WXL01]